MTEADLVAALRPVVEAFDALGVRYFLGGSVASSAHGVARASLDADVIAELDPSHVDLRRWSAALGVGDLLERALDHAAS